MTFVRNPIVRWLLSHSYGQGGTVAVPVPDTQTALSMPRGQFPPGISDVLDHLSRRYREHSTSSDEIDWCFLIGGPGNGKSEALRELTKRLDIALAPAIPGEPAPRSIPRNWPSEAHRLVSGLDIVLINDASIPRGDLGSATQTGSLFHDLSDAFRRIPQSRLAIFANVNRGILIEEASSLAANVSQDDSESLATSTIRCLAGQRSASELETIVSPEPNAPQYAQYKVTVAGITVIIHVVFLDVLSLLEPTPGAGGPVIDFRAYPPLVAPYQTFGKLLSHDLPRDSTTAGAFVSSFVALDYWEAGGCKDPTTGTLCEAFPTCPFAQNSRWVQSEPLRSRFVDALRGAEIAAGRRLTYRDLLGHISLALIGEPEEQWLTGYHPCEWSANAHRGIRNGQKSAAIDVASHRVYVNLFSNSADHASTRFEPALAADTVYGSIKTRATTKGQPARLQAFEKAFADVDPAADTDPWGGVRARVLDAVESLDIVSPADQIRSWSEVHQAAVSEIEDVLDQTLRDEITTELKRNARVSVNRVRFLRRWRSMMLLRQIGLAMGRLTHGNAIESWLAEQENALRGGTRLSLGDGIHNLIVPTRETHRIYLAPLRPRTYCLVEDLPANTLLFPITVNDLDVLIVPQGDTLIAEVLGKSRRGAKVLASLVVDLAVAREAVLHTDGDERSFTEIGYTAFARIERARASLITRERLKTGGIYFTSENRVIHRIVANPSGSIALRVEKS